MTDDDETNFPHKLLLANIQVANLRKAFASYLSANIKLSKTQISRMIQSRGRFWWTSWSNTKNRITVNKKCN